MPRLFHPLFLVPALIAAPAAFPVLTPAAQAQAPWLPPKQGPAVVLSAEEWQRARDRYNTVPEVQAATRPVIKQADEARAATPQPLKRIEIDGRRERDAQRIESEKRLEDMEKLRALSYAYSATGETRYGNTAREFVLAWVRTLEPSGNPINDNKLEAIFLTAMTHRDLFTDADRELLNKWMRRIADSASAKSGNAAWEIARAKNLALIGLALEDQKLLANAVGLTRVAVQRDLRPGGGSAELELHDALSYHVAGVKPLLELAIALRGVDPGLYAYTAPNGASIKASVDFVKPYARGEKVYPQWRNTKFPLDKRWWEAGDANYEPGSPWRPREGVLIMELAGFFDAEATELAGKTRYGMGISWTDVLAQAARTP